MKDKSGKNAAHQRAYKARMIESGFYQKQVWVHGESYKVGFDAGQLGSGSISDFPPGLVDKKSWAMGYVDGAIKSKLWA